MIKPFIETGRFRTTRRRTFRVVVETCPGAIVITRVSDGGSVYLNDRFLLPHGDTGKE